MTRYALYAIPPKVDREKLALLRRQLIHKHGGGHAVRYPIHCTLVRGVRVRDPDALIEQVRQALAGVRPVTLQAHTSLVAGEWWAGVLFRDSAVFERLRARLRAVVALYALEEVPAGSRPHVSLAYGKRITGVGRIVSPIKRLVIDRVTVARQESIDGPYRVVAELEIGKERKDAA